MLDVTGAHGQKCDRFSLSFAHVAQLVEQGTENPRVGGSIPSLATISFHTTELS